MPTLSSCGVIKNVATTIYRGASGQCGGATFVGAAAGGVGGYLAGQAISDDARVQALTSIIGGIGGAYAFGKACENAQAQEAELEARFAAVRAERDSLAALQDGTFTEAEPSVELVQVEDVRTAEDGSEVTTSSLMTKIEFGSDVLNYPSGSAVLPSQAELYLAPLAETLKASEGQQVVIVVGHTDTVGDAASNLTLSEQRAASVADYLKAQGVSQDRVQALGAGEHKPIVEEERTEQDRRRNRRVEVMVVHHTGATAS